MNSVRCITIVVFCCILTIGCRARIANEPGTRYYFGLTVIEVPPSYPKKSDFFVNEVANIGFGIEKSSVSFGYNKSKEVFLPIKGAIYIEVQTDGQLNFVKELIDKYPDKNICVTKNGRRLKLSAK